MLWHMIHPTLKKNLQNIDITVSLYVLAELIEEGIFYQVQPRVIVLLKKCY